MKKEILMGNTFQNMRKTFQNITIEYFERKEKRIKKSAPAVVIRKIRLKPLFLILIMGFAFFSAYSLISPEKARETGRNETILKIENTDDSFGKTAAYISEIMNKIEKSGFASIQTEWLTNTPPEIKEDAETFLNHVRLSKLNCKNLIQDKTSNIFTMFCSADNNSFKVKIRKSAGDSFNLVSIE